MKINKTIGKVVLGTFGVMGLMSVAFSNLPLLNAAVPTGLLPNSSPEVNQAFTGQIAIAPALQSFQVSALPVCNSTTTTTVNALSGALLTAGFGVEVMAANVSVAITPGINVTATSTGANIAMVVCGSTNNSVATQWTIVGG